MSFSIYMYEGDQETLITEKFDQPSTTKINIYVGMASRDSLGFDSNDKAIKFVKMLLDQRITILFPALSLISSEEEIEKYIHKLKGVTFLDNSELIKLEFDKYLLYESKMKKNALLARYNKPVENLETPAILTWYDSKSRKYTKDFENYCRSNGIDFIIWAFSDFGIYFFTFKTINNEVVEIANQLDINLVQVDDIRRMPYH